MRLRPDICTGMWYPDICLQEGWVISYNSVSLQTCGSLRRRLKRMMRFVVACFFRGSASSLDHLSTVGQWTWAEEGFCCGIKRRPFNNKIRLGPVVVSIGGSGSEDTSIARAAPWQDDRCFVVSGIQSYGYKYTNKTTLTPCGNDHVETICFPGDPYLTLSSLCVDQNIGRSNLQDVIKGIDRSLFVDTGHSRIHL